MAEETKYYKLIPSAKEKTQNLISAHYLHKNLYDQNLRPDNITAIKNSVMNRLVIEGQKTNSLVGSLNKIIEDVKSQEDQVLKFLGVNDQEFKKEWANLYNKKAFGAFKKQTGHLAPELEKLIEYLATNEEVNKLKLTYLSDEELGQIKDILISTLENAGVVNVFEFLTQIENKDSLTKSDKVKRKIMSTITEIEKITGEQGNKDSFYQRMRAATGGIKGIYGSYAKKAKIRERGSARGFAVAFQSSALNDNSKKGQVNEYITTEVVEDMFNEFFKNTSKKHYIYMTSQEKGAQYGDTSKNILVTKSVKGDIQVDIPESASGKDGPIDLKSFGISAKIGESDTVKLQTSNSIKRLGQLLSSYNASQSLGELLREDDFLYIFGNELKTHEDKSFMDAFKRAVSLYGYIYIGNMTDIVDTENDQYFGLGKKYANVLFLSDADEIYRVSDLLENLRKFLQNGESFIRVEVDKLIYNYDLQERIKNETPLEEGQYYGDDYLSRMKSAISDPAINKVQITMRAARKNLFEGLK